MPRLPLALGLLLLGAGTVAALAATRGGEGGAPAAAEPVAAAHVVDGTAAHVVDGTAAPVAAPRVPLDSLRLAPVYARAATLPRLRSLLVQQHDSLVGERYFHGATATRPANIKSASKSVMSALAGIALAEGTFRGLDQPLGELLPAETRGLDSAKRAIRLEDLLTMRAGLQSTSFGGYGAWVSSRNWVRDALRRPMVDEPGHRGGDMIYSTGTSHLLSAALTHAAGTSTYEYARRKLAAPLGIRLRPWLADPQGIYFGGNEMHLTPRDMVKFGQLYLRRGRGPDGTQLLPAAWIDSSWVPRTRSRFNDNRYGYGWWIREAAGHPVYFAWGYGGQYVFVVPSLDLVVVTTSDPNAPSRSGNHRDEIYDLLEDIVTAAA
jgi:CubicO group peptidase (beta-lactamase class C family)